MISFFIARYLTVSLRGPVQTLRRDTERRVLGWETYLEKKDNPDRVTLAEFFPRNVNCTDWMDGLDGGVHGYFNEEILKTIPIYA